MRDTRTARYESLEATLRRLGSAAVAFSGGVDSTLLLRAARQALGDNLIAITAAGAVHPTASTDAARDLAGQAGVRHVVLELDFLGIEGFESNPTDRCYRCKRAMLSRFRDVAAEHGIEHLVDGTNADDVEADRPGMRALRELGILTPLRDAGLTKQDIRQLSRELGLPTWNRPSDACLATRFPYGTELTRERLARVETAEAVLHDAGFAACRVRCHGALARIEVEPEQMPRLVSAGTADVIARKLEDLGFRQVTLDLQGRRSGGAGGGSAVKGGSGGRG